MKKYLYICLCMIIVFAFSGCGALRDIVLGGPTEVIGSVRFGFDMAYPASIGYEITQVSVALTHQVSQVVVEANLSVDQQNATASGTVTDLAVGMWDIVVELHQDATVVGTGSGTGEVIAGQLGEVTIDIALATGGLSFTVSWVSGSTEPEYAIGDTGPAGGIIFYDDEADGADDIADARYLEAAPASTEWIYKTWGGYGYEVGGTEVAVGSGEANTAAIVAEYGDVEPSAVGTSEYAARLCYLLEYGGSDDWFLPSKDELDLMHQNLHGQGLGGFSDGNYWSSSEIDAYNAWDQYFFNGAQHDDAKIADPNVRAIRAF
jgi:hypothetical protein